MKSENVKARHPSTQKCPVDVLQGNLSMELLPLSNFHFSDINESGFFQAGGLKLIHQIMTCSAKQA